MRRNRQDEALEVAGLSFKNVTEFRYLGSFVTSDNDMEYEVASRIQSGSRCLFSLDHVFCSRVLSRKAMLRVYKAVLRPTITYGCETWNLTARAQKRRLTFENKVLRQILRPKRYPLTARLRMRSNEEARRFTGQPLITRTIKSHRLRWAGHVARAPPTRYIRQVLDGRPTSPRPRGRPRLRWEDNVSADAGRLGVLD